ncbi:MAG: hypothetical protein ABW321_18255 [Polyangiales bacterium]
MSGSGKFTAVVVCAGFCATLVLAACDPHERMQTVIAVNAGELIQQSVSDVTIHVESLTGDGERSDQVLEHPEWPLSLVFAPKNDDAKRTFKLEVSARDTQSNKLVAFRVTAGYVRDAARYASIMIHDSCLESDERVCNTADCNSLILDMDRLGSSMANAAQLQVHCRLEKDPEGPPSGEPGMTNAGGDAGAAAPTIGAGGSGGGAPVTSGAAGAAGTGDPGPDGPNVPPDDNRGPCRSGFRNTGSGCEDIDECSSGPCGANGVCANLDGDYRCDCAEGFGFRDGTCGDDNECEDNNNGGCAGVCDNRPGGYACSCPESGTWLKADRFGCGSFKDAFKLDDSTSTQRGEPQVAFDGEGNGLAVWIQADGSKVMLRSARFVRGEGWQAPIKVHESTTLSQPTLALAPVGSGTLLWLQAGAAHLELWYASFGDGAFGAAAPLAQSETSDALLPGIALDNNGNGVAVWTSTGGGSAGRVMVSHYIQRNGTFVGQLPIAGSEAKAAFAGQVAIDQQGRATVAWTEYDIVDGAVQFTGGGEAHAARFDPMAVSRGWSMQSTLDMSPSLFPSIAHSPTGQGVAVWSRFENDGLVVVANEFEPTEGFGETRLLSTAASQVTITSSDRFLGGPHIAANPGNDFVALWVQRQGSQRSVWSSSRNGATGQWTEATKVNDADSTVRTWTINMLPVFDPALDLALDQRGGGFAVWSDFGAEDARVVRARRLVAGAELGVALELLSDTVPKAPSTVQVALDPVGDGAVIWDHQNAEGNYEVWLRRIE